MKSLANLLTLLFAIAIVLAVAARAQETTIYNFKGITSDSALLFHSNRLFGSTINGGPAKLGTVFRLTPVSGQTQWTRKVLHGFTGPNDEDGSIPSGKVIRDKTGVLYVATEFFDISCCGAVFKLTPPPLGGNAWTTTVLYYFKGGSDGDQPVGGLTMDSSGALYGATIEGGDSNRGTIFKLTPAEGQTFWTETQLFIFTGGDDGGNPNGDLLLDQSGALLGTTAGGGLFGDGTAFVLNPPSGEPNWTETVIHNFEGESDSSFPNGGLVGGVGDVFGTTEGPVGTETSDFGIVFELRQEILGNPVYTLNVLHKFTGTGGDGALPKSGLLRHASGVLWGTTLEGGVSDDGTVFKLTPSLIVVDQFKYSVVHSFSGGPDDGGWPYSTPTAGPTGTLYGTTAIGGTYGYGTVYQLVP